MLEELLLAYIFLVIDLIPNKIIELLAIQYIKNRYTLSGSYVELTANKDDFSNCDYK
ncbi:hypothetical protein Lreu23DRAFT_4277 [Limosilactobacillus reuteri subsp. rodentium]|uniref:Uncharacterized protein n=1 Tax=Limosilactobacillus reuteri subsp. rodentium (strain DSM 17509 / CIP 109821 / 100-23) TaxID=349123 RepID=B3XNV0_LIMR1|nr:hypothetical protein Lreu23DRAFT_4277 [Limosilactobacillus reuteri subsp. rodentium]